MVLITWILGQAKLAHEVKHGIHCSHQWVARPWFGTLIFQFCLPSYEKALWMKGLKQSSKLWSQEWDTWWRVNKYSSFCLIWSNLSYHILHKQNTLIWKDVQSHRCQFQVANVQQWVIFQSSAGKAHALQNKRRCCSHSYLNLFVHPLSNNV